MDDETKKVILTGKKSNKYNCPYCFPKKEGMFWVKQEVTELNGIEIKVEDFFTCKEHGIILQEKKFNHSRAELNKIKKDFE